MTPDRAHPAQYRQYKARIEARPEPYGTVAKALQRYVMY